MKDELEQLTYQIEYARSQIEMVGESVSNYNQVAYNACYGVSGYLAYIADDLMEMWRELISEDN